MKTGGSFYDTNGLADRLTARKLNHTSCLNCPRLRGLVGLSGANQGFVGPIGT